MKKNNSRESSEALPQLHLERSWEDNTQLLWLIKNGRTIFYSLIAMLALFILVYRFAFSSGVRAEIEFLNADNDFTAFRYNLNEKSDAEASNEALSKLNAILTQYPELHAKYDALIAQTLLNQGRVQEASPYANLALKRTHDENSPYYSDYAETSLLIGNAQYENALKRANNLHENMLSNKSEEATDTMLFAFNLLRIALLQQALNLPDEEQKTWELWKKYQDTRSFQSALAIFTAGKTSLLQYIESREQFLKAK